MRDSFIGWALFFIGWCMLVMLAITNGMVILMGREFVGGLMVATCFYMIVAIIILIVIGEI